MKPPPPLMPAFSLLKSFHDFSILTLLMVGVLMIGIGVLVLVRPADGLLQHRWHFLLFASAVMAVALPATALLFSPIRRTIKPGGTKEFTAFLAARGYQLSHSALEVHEFTPGTTGFLTFHHEKVRIYFCQGNAPSVDLPRYLLMSLPKGCLA